MTIGVIELRSNKSPDAWYPAAVGNVTGATGRTVRYPAYTAKRKIEEGFSVMTFLKTGMASSSERVQPQLKEHNLYFLTQYGKAVGAMQNSSRWYNNYINPNNVRLVKFDTITEFNAYLTTKRIPTVAVRTEVTPEIVLADVPQSVSELYNELAKVMAKDPSAATARVVKCKDALTNQVLSDAEALATTTAIGKALLANAVNAAAEALEIKANEEVARIYRELAPKSRVPKIKLLASVIPPETKASKNGV